VELTRHFKRRVGGCSLSDRFLSLAVVFLLVVSGSSLVATPARAPLAVLLALATTSVPLGRAWRAARGTALRAALAWTMLAVAFGIAAQAAAVFEPVASGRPFAGHLEYLSVLATLAALGSVLNARTPGGVAWAILMALLVVVFLIPWLEGPSLARKAQGLGRLRLEAPWTLFYGLLVVAGVTNFLPTRYGLAAAWLAAGFVGEYLALTRSAIRRGTGGLIWSAVPWTLAAAIWTAWWSAGRAGRVRNEVDAIWLWFRDHWGVVWALRIQERFNRTAETLGWPIRLGWYGTLPVPGTPAGDDAAVPAAAGTTLRGLLRRFASPDRIREATRATAAPLANPRRAGDDTTDSAGPS
jgi:hypothetical protein